jgi:LPS O-antigen subunit length determinant protein (WzzB/FepE family)
MTRNPPNHDQGLTNYYQEDEISLVDLWLVLVRRRAIFITVAALCLVAGLLYAIAMPRSYQYSTSIEIGSRHDGASIELVESPETLLAKINESYIPLARQQYLLAHPELQAVPDMDARIPKGSQIIVLGSKGAETESEMHVALQQAVVDMVKKDHGRMIDVLRKESEIQQQRATAKLDELKDEASLLQAREKRLADMANLLGKQASEARDDLQQAQGNRQRATGAAKDAAQAMTLLMLDSEIQQHRLRLAKLDERLQIEMAENQDKLTKALADNRRAQTNQQNNIAKLDIQLANLRETRALLPPMRAAEPAGPGRSVIVALALMLGLMLGVFAAFVAEFLAKAREQSKQGVEVS